MGCIERSATPPACSRIASTPAHLLAACHSRGSRDEAAGGHECRWSRALHDSVAGRSTCDGNIRTRSSPCGAPLPRKALGGCPAGPDEAGGGGVPLHGTGGVSARNLFRSLVSLTEEPEGVEVALDNRDACMTASSGVSEQTLFHCRASLMGEPSRLLALRSLLRASAGLGLVACGGGAGVSARLGLPGRHLLPTCAGDNAEVAEDVDVQVRPQTPQQHVYAYAVVLPCSLVAEWDGTLLAGGSDLGWCRTPPKHVCAYAGELPCSPLALLADSLLRISTCQTCWHLALL